MEVNERFLINNKYALLPINVGLPSFVTNSNHN